MLLHPQPGVAPPPLGAALQPSPHPPRWGPHPVPNLSAQAPGMPMNASAAAASEPPTSGMPSSVHMHAAPVQPAAAAPEQAPPAAPPVAKHPVETGAETGPGGSVQPLSVSDALAAAASLCDTLHLGGGGAGEAQGQSRTHADGSPSDAAHPAPISTSAGAPEGLPAAASSAGAAAADADEILGYITLENGQMMAVRRGALMPAAAGAAEAAAATVADSGRAQAGGPRVPGDVPAAPNPGAATACSMRPVAAPGEPLSHLWGDAESGVAVAWELSCGC